MVEEEISAVTGLATHPDGPSLRNREIRLGPDRLVSQVMTLVGYEAGYEKIDNEILAGLRLCRMAGTGGYPPEVSRLVGYSADDIEAFVLLEPYRGVPVTEIAGKLLTGDRRQFEVSLLTGLRWLGLVGIAHRGIGPDTVRWDERSRTAQITDFTSATVFGVPRQAVRSAPWAAPEQRLGRAAGEVSDRDDIWAAGRLIFYVITGDEPADRDSLLAEPELARLLDGVFGPPEARPACRDLLVGRLGVRDPVPPQPAEDPVLAEGRAEFWDHRGRPQTKGSPSGSPAANERSFLRRRKGTVAVAAGVIALLLAVVVISIVIR
jgi:serine/threonine protein kinase